MGGGIYLCEALKRCKPGQISGLGLTAVIPILVEIDGVRRSTTDDEEPRNEQPR